MVVKQLFALKDKQRLFIHIESFNWNFENFGPVFLDFGNCSIKCRYTAFSNQAGQPVLELALQDSVCGNVEEVALMFEKASEEVLLNREQ